MNHIIISRDSYLRLALSLLSVEAQLSRPVCIIDVESCASLADIEDSLEQYQVNAAHRIFFLGGQGVNSKVLRHLVSARRNSSLSGIRTLLLNGFSAGYKNSLRYLRQCRELHFCTSLQRLVAYGIRQTPDAHTAATLINMSKSTVYASARSLGSKLQLDTTTELRQFLRNEFSSRETHRIILSPRHTGLLPLGFRRVTPPECRLHQKS